jgi:hypothetical protein
VTQLYPQTPGSLFITFYDSQGYGGGTCLILFNEIIVAENYTKYITHIVGKIYRAGGKVKSKAIPITGREGT